MSNSSSYAVAQTHTDDRFYTAPASRRSHHYMLPHQQLQRQLQKPLKSDTLEESVEPEKRTESDEPTLSRPSSVSSSSPPMTANLTNLDRLIEAFTPFIPAQLLTEPNLRECKASGSAGDKYFCLGDLWESLREWSAYGVEVPLLLNSNKSVKQYYVPYLSGIQIYVEPYRPRRPGEDSDSESSMGTSRAGSSNCETEKKAGGAVEGMWLPHNMMKLNCQRLSRLTLRNRLPMTSLSDESEVCDSTGLLEFEYFEHDPPHLRPPLFDKVASLSSEFPHLRKYSSCDLSPLSWFSVAWYPIYSIPVGSLKSSEASFLTFYRLSTQSRRSKNQPQFHACSDRKVLDVDTSSMTSLPVFALASYKLIGSQFTPDGASEWQQASDLEKAADDWLQRLEVNLPDYKFFISRSSQQR